MTKNGTSDTPEPTPKGNTTKELDSQEIFEGLVDTTKISYAELKGKPCDPDGSLVVPIYNRVKKTMRQQSLKRSKLMGRSVIYTGVDNQPHVGKIFAFYVENGLPAFVGASDIAPKEGEVVMILEE